MTPREALRSLLPGDAVDLQILESLAESPVSATWLVTVSGRRAVLRVDRPLARQLGLPRHAEPGVLRAVAAAGLGPGVLAADPERGLLLTEWLPGRSLSAGDDPGPGSLRAVAGLLRAVHALEIAAPSLDLYTVIDRYARLAGSQGAGLAAGVRGRLSACLALPGLPAAFCHNDPSPANIITTATIPSNDSHLRLIDWEYAGQNQPEFDLAVYAAEARLSPAAATGLLQRYLGRSPDSAEWRRHEAWLAFYFDLALLWTGAVFGGNSGP